MLLRLEEGIEVPEGALNVAIRRHLREAHLEEDLSELRSDLHEGMEMAAGRRDSQRFKVVRLELLLSPRAAEITFLYRISSTSYFLLGQHVDGQIGLGLGQAGRESGALLENKRFDSSKINEK